MSLKRTRRGKKRRSVLPVCATVFVMAFAAALLSLTVLSTAGIVELKWAKKPQAEQSTSAFVPPPPTPKSEKTEAANTPQITDGQGESPETTTDKTERGRKGIVVLDAGHGKSSSAMSDAEKSADGWLYNSQKGGWGEWRHWKSGTVWQDCLGSGCTGRAPQSGGCWYPMGAGDRSTEPQINMNNVLAAKKYLEELGYEVRPARRSADENPSMTKRLTYCYPNCDTTKDPDADVFVCVHSNAGGGRGSCYIALSGLYDQAQKPMDYIDSGNLLGRLINDRIVSETSLSAAGSDGRYDGYPELVLFCKSPVTIAYMEIGFFDNSSDLAILQSESDKIGKAIAYGVDDYLTQR